MKIGNDLITKSDIARIARRDPGAVHVSLFIPTHRSGAGIEQDRIRWKNLLIATNDVLCRAGLRSSEAAALLSDAWAVHDDGLFWQHMSDGLAYFVAPTWRRLFRVPTNLPEVGAVGEHFVVGPLLPMLTGDTRFLLLTLSQNKVRLLAGSRYAMDEVPLRGVPTSLREVVEPAEPRSDAMARRTSSRGVAGTPGAVFYGYGAADKDLRKTDLEEFFRRVSAGLHAYLRDERIPLVVAGVDYLIPIFRSINTYPSLMDGALVGNFDDLPPGKLHDQAWPIVRAAQRAEERRTIDRFHEKHGTGLATDDPEEVEAAAAAGRVDTLIFAGELRCWEQAAAEWRVVQLGTDASSQLCERLDRAAVDTLLHGGQVTAVPVAEVPGSADMAAILRY